MMSPVDRDVLRRKLSRIVQCLQRIKTAEDLSLDDYTADADLQPIMERQLELAMTLAPATGLRNRLVHQYDEINHALVYQGLHEALKHFPEYISAIEAYLEQSQ